MRIDDKRLKIDDKRLKIDDKPKPRFYLSSANRRRELFAGEKPYIKFKI